MSSGTDSTGAGTPTTEHRQDESAPVEFRAHVGHIARCICGAGYVGGYPCPNDPRYQPGGEFENWRDR